MNSIFYQEVGATRMSLLFFGRLWKYSAFIVIQTLNKAYYTKSYQRMPFEVFVEITSKGSIDNLFTKIISLEESIKERVWYVGGFL